MVRHFASTVMAMKRSLILLCNCVELVQADNMRAKRQERWKIDKETVMSIMMMMDNCA